MDLFGNRRLEEALHEIRRAGHPHPAAAYMGAGWHLSHIGVRVVSADGDGLRVLAQGARGETQEVVVIVVGLSVTILRDGGSATFRRGEGDVDLRAALLSLRWNGGTR